MNTYLKQLLRLLAMITVVTQVAATGFDFGQGSGIIVKDGGTLDLSNGACITDGFIETNGGEVIVECESVEGHNATWIVKGDEGLRSSVTFDGCLREGDRVNLSNGDVFYMNGSLVVTKPVARGSHIDPSFLRGIGSPVDGDYIDINTGSTLVVDLNGVLRSNINLKGDEDACEGDGNNAERTAVLSLANNLTFAPFFAPVTHCVSDPGYNRIKFNNHRMTFGGEQNTLSDDAGALRLPHPQWWDTANVALSGPVVMGCHGAIIFETPGVIDGNGNTLYIGDSWRALRNGTNDITLQNLTISGDYDVDWFEGCLGAWNCTNTTIVSEGNSITIDGSFSRTTNIYSDETYFGHKNRLYIPDEDGEADFRALLTIDYDPLLKKGVNLSAVLNSHSVQFLDQNSRSVFYDNLNSRYVSKRTQNGDLIRLTPDVVISGTPAAGTAVSGTAESGQFSIDSVAATFDSVSLYIDTEGDYVALSGESYYKAVVSFYPQTEWTETADEEYSDYVIDTDAYVTDVNGDYVYKVYDTNDYIWLNEKGDPKVLNGSVTFTGTLAAEDFTATTVWSHVGGYDVYVDSTNNYVADNGGTYYRVTLSFTKETEARDLDDDGDDDIEEYYVDYADSHETDVNDNWVYYNRDTDEYAWIESDGTAYVLYYNGWEEYYYPATDDDNDDNYVKVNNYQSTCTDATDATIRLNSNVTLDGRWYASRGTTVTIDLNGYTLDLCDGALGATDCDATLVVKNGTIKGLNNCSFDFNDDSTLILENVAMHISSNTRWRYATLVIKGECSIHGSPRSVFENRSSENLVILRNSTLKLTDGIIYNHNSDESENFVFESKSSHLEMMGATFRREDTCGECGPLYLTVGTLILDHKSVMQPGSGGIQIGDGDCSYGNLAVVVRPGATLSISSDECADVSAGTVVYANISDCDDC